MVAGNDDPFTTKETEIIHNWLSGSLNNIRKKVDDEKIVTTLNHWLETKLMKLRKDVQQK